MKDDTSNHEKVKRDISEYTITMKIKHIWTVFFAVVTITVTLVAGWLDLRAEAAEAKRGVDSLTNRVARIECLIGQQNNYQIYGIKPITPCN